MAPERIIDFEVQDCVRCGFLFGAPKSFFDQRRYDGKSFYCPACNCSMSWNGERNRLQKERNELQKRVNNLAAQNERLNRCCDQQFNEAQHFKRSRAAYKAHLTRRKNKEATADDQAQVATG